MERFNKKTHQKQLIVFGVKKIVMKNILIDTSSIDIYL